MGRGLSENAPYLFDPLFEEGFEERLQRLVSDAGYTPVRKAKSPLVPYVTTVYPKSGRPYQTTRWRRMTRDDESPIHVVPVASYQGNLAEVHRAWYGFLSRLQDVPDQLLAPVVALQEILTQGRLGLLAVQDNRVVGVAVVQPGQNLVTASPLDQIQGKNKQVEQVLKQGLRAYEVTE